MTAVRRITATILATVASLLGLLAIAAVAAASPVDNDGNVRLPQPPTSANTTIVNNGSPWWTRSSSRSRGRGTLLVSLLVADPPPRSGNANRARAQTRGTNDCRSRKRDVDQTPC